MNQPSLERVYEKSGDAISDEVIGPRFRPRRQYPLKPENSVEKADVLER